MPHLKKAFSETTLYQYAPPDTGQSLSVRIAAAIDQYMQQNRSERKLITLNEDMRQLIRTATAEELNIITHECSTLELSAPALRQLFTKPHQWKLATEEVYCLQGRTKADNLWFRYGVVHCGNLHFLHQAAQIALKDTPHTNPFLAPIPWAIQKCGITDPQGAAVDWSQHRPDGNTKLKELLPDTYLMGSVVTNASDYQPKTELTVDVIVACIFAAAFGMTDLIKPNMGRLDNHIVFRDTGELLATSKSNFMNWGFLTDQHLNKFLNQDQIKTLRKILEQLSEHLQVSTPHRQISPALSYFSPVSCHSPNEIFTGFESPDINQNNPFCNLEDIKTCELSGIQSNDSNGSNGSNMSRHSQKKPTAPRGSPSKFWGSSSSSSSNNSNHTQDNPPTPTQLHSMFGVQPHNSGSASSDSQDGRTTTRQQDEPTTPTKEQFTALVQRVAILKTTLDESTEGLTLNQIATNLSPEWKEQYDALKSIQDLLLTKYNTAEELNHAFTKDKKFYLSNAQDAESNQANDPGTLLSALIATLNDNNIELQHMACALAGYPDQYLKVENILKIYRYLPKDFFITQELTMPTTTCSP